MRRALLPSTALASWARLNNVEFNGCAIEHLGEEPTGRGFAAIAQRDIAATEAGPLMTVPSDLILSAEAVEGYAKADVHLRQLLDAVGDLSKTARGAILLYLLLQITIASPDCHERIGVSGPITEYARFLSAVSLPTTWTSAEQGLLIGTSLEAALSAKLRRTQREFDHMRLSTASIPWCARMWWEQDQLTVEDWLLVDSWFRSRALSFGTDADALVPCVDMLNHTRGEETNVYFDRDQRGNAVLLRPPGTTFRQGEEITLSYGDGKSASEMLFSYGFLEPAPMGTAALSLDLDISTEDPLKRAKEAIMAEAAAVRVSSDARSSKWESATIWLACVNEEDGLGFEVFQTNDGDRELRAYWHERDITNDSGVLQECLLADPLWPVFELRAATLVRGRVMAQLERLGVSEAAAEAARSDPTVRSHVWSAAMELRGIEQELLRRCAQDLDAQQARLLATEVVQRYLGGAEATAAAAGVERGMDADDADDGGDGEPDAGEPGELGEFA
ncbi:MAG: hypothetical protein M1838_001780 [Thelocarpon superellum]|nr:MAG: hypothetical protein M1838_001780 [Thelocarpon superellum]